MTLGQTGVLRYMAILVILWSSFGDRMANLVLIEFTIRFYIKVNLNVGQNKFEAHFFC